MTVRITGDWGKFDGRLERVVGFNFTALSKEIGEHIVTSTQERFKKGVGPGGEPWPQSIRAKEEQGQTLVKTKRLMGSLSYRASGTQVAAGTNVIYASVHQTGKMIKAKRGKYLRFRLGKRWVSKATVEIPARPFMGIDDDDVKEIRSIINDRIEERLR